MAKRTDLKVSAGQLKAAAQKTLNLLQDETSDELSDEQTAVVALWPEAIRDLNDDERKSQLRLGTDTVLFDDPKQKTIRGFVRAVLRIPLSDPDNEGGAAVYGVFVEVDRPAYALLKKAHKEKTPTRVWGKLATRLPLLEDAFESKVALFEDGSQLRARIVDAESTLIQDGPEVGPL
ncbi:MAG: DUF2199 domain-containing protein [Deltaproteobacteria bacterium]|nr:DUF2199 domain-containing protein [Deltaproteobacteria bacterium]